jgi:uncharacterized Ntn-hydrolase superfamily protein
VLLPRRCRRVVLLPALVVVVLGATFSAQGLGGRDDDIHTYSIIGYDPATGDVGIAIASRVFNVSSFYGKAGVGVVTLQHSFSGENLMTAPEGVKLLEKGLAPADVIKTLMAKDAGREWRQIGVIDTKGRVAAYTGPKCTYWSGDRQGQNFTTQGNMLTGKITVDSMADTFASTQGELADKLMAALLKADTVGGDARGKQSASLRVFRAGSKTTLGTTIGADVEPMSYYVDLRVMDAEQPVREMDRMWKKVKDFRLPGQAIRTFDAGDSARAIQIAKDFIARRPDEANGYETLGVIYYRMKQPDEALKWFKEANKHLPRFKELFQMRIGVIRDRVGGRDPYSMFEKDPEFVKRVLQQ